jgi:hypothetical protein
MERCWLAVFHRPPVILELKSDDRVFQVAGVTPSTHMGEKRSPKVWSPETLMELVAVTVQAQDVRGRRRPLIRFCVVLRVIFDWSFRITADVAGTGG